MNPRSTVVSRPYWHRRLRHLAVLPVVAALALVFSACSSGGSGGGGGAAASSTWSPDPAHPITITWANWADAEDTTRPGIEKMISDFEQSHPGILVKSVPVAFTDIGHTLVLETQSGNTPDVAQVSGNDTFAVAATGALEPLDSWMGSDKSLFMPSELGTSTYQGKLIAMPWMVNPPALWYNKTLMQGAGLDPNSPPKTIDELMSDLAVIHAKYPDVLAMGLDTTNRDFALASNWSWMATFNAIPFTGSTPSADTAGMQAYLGWMRELAQKGYLSAGKKIGEFRPLAAQNQVAFLWDQPVMQGVAQAANKQTDDQFYANWGVEAQPAGPSGKSFSVELGHQLVMFKNSKYKQADYEFMKWLATSDDDIENFVIPIESSLPPLATPNADIQKMLQNPITQAFVTNVMPTVSNPSYGPAYSEASSPIMSGVQAAVTSDTPLPQVASTMQSAMQSAFQ